MCWKPGRFAAGGRPSGMDPYWYTSRVGAVVDPAAEGRGPSRVDRDQVGVLAGLDRADRIVEPQGPGPVERPEPEPVERPERRRLDAVAAECPAGLLRVGARPHHAEQG